MSALDTNSATVVAPAMLLTLAQRTLVRSLWASVHPGPALVSIGLVEGFRLRATKLGMVSRRGLAGTVEDALSGNELVEDMGGKW